MWNPDARDPWPAERYLREDAQLSSWWLVIGAACAVVAAIAGGL